MSGLFTGKKPRGARGRETAKAETADQYDGMIMKALERLTRWAFPDSQVERQGVGVWQLWHTADGGEK